ncbi:histidinol-phosphate transaminase [Maricaulis maris]|jgi:histidinol-phosphate aminotransferase|uniref:Histidinol-phosphate aminotransferase n=1 Tax=Maricaulis maris (strain MCS10) TaxID=394221 RepID=HIS8_MARMM|nr:histidinol-phosphate transaminase [Maricaulis maris]Q0AM22.1 RecName: Full=Histidinol-phosphate aminotransferase; AltName: Full=Imidazole acetol-phosphate transaminase [Maricaulis maris MCS10]ABI66671.1 histidinol phosphate aminotransferase apoenzyme [Maricaulis maris MCS10]
MAIEPRAGILDIRPYKPGSSEAPGIENPVKLSSNENALGCSDKAAAAMTATASKLHLYPDGGATKLREAIAEAEGLEAENIVCGTGSDELLQLLGRAYLNPGDKVVQSQYGFLVYRLVAMQCGANLVSAPERDYRSDVDAILEAAGDDTRIVFLANPNNPTGTYISAAEVRRLRDGLPASTLLVLDAAYAEFVDNPDYEAGIELARERDDVIVTRTFSKIHGLAALRLGWAYGNKAIIDVLHRVRGPFNVNMAAIEAGTAAIQDRDFMKRSVEHNEEWVAFLRQQIGGLGLEVTPSVCNFVLIHFPETPGKTAADADAYLTSQGLIIRAVDPYGLPNALRATVGSETENRRLVDALSTFMKA